MKHAKYGLCHICDGTVLESRSAISLVQRSPCLRRRVAACPVLHVQLETSQRDATLAVVQHLHRSARAAGRPVVQRHAVIMELSHHGFSTVNISGVGRPTASVEKCHFVVVVQAAVAAAVAGQSKLDAGAGARHCIRDEVGHNLSSTDAAAAAADVTSFLLLKPKRRPIAAVSAT